MEKHWKLVRMNQKSREAKKPYRLSNAEFENLLWARFLTTGKGWVRTFIPGVLAFYLQGGADFFSFNGGKLSKNWSPICSQIPLRTLPPYSTILANLSTAVLSSLLESRVWDGEVGKEAALWHFVIEVEKNATCRSACPASIYWMPPLAFGLQNSLTLLCLGIKMH